MGIETNISGFYNNFRDLSSAKNDGGDRPSKLPGVIDTKNNAVLLKQFFTAILEGQSAAFFNPSWSAEEKQFAETLLEQAGFTEKSLVQNETFFLIPTGGSSGKIKFATHTFRTLSASVSGFQQFFKVETVNCFCVLPLYHVSGLMQVMRSLLSGGKFWLGDYTKLKQENVPEEDFSDFCISLVPTQLQVLLDACPKWLQQFRLVLIGGAPAWRSLLEQARDYGIRVALTYGMTETASQVVALKPEDFLVGKDYAGQVLPHAKLHLSEEGLISIEAKSLFHGYYPEMLGDRRLVTDDIGYFDEAEYLHLMGRQSQKIISGGENIYPAEIEAAIQATNLVQDVAVCGIPDSYWGEAVIAVVVLKTDGTIEAIKQAIASRLSRYKLPKHWLSVDSLPRNAQGKLNRTILRAMIEKDYEC